LEGEITGRVTAVTGVLQNCTEALRDTSQPHSKGKLFADCHSILHRLKQPLVQVTELFAVTNVRQTATHTAETPALEQSAFGDEIRKYEMQ
jgi:hypothetical protein